MQTQHNYTAVANEKIPQEGLILKKENNNIICINRAPMYSQDQFGQLNIQQLSCATNCPFANVKKNDAGEFIYQISCKTHIQEFKLTNVEQLEKHFAPAEEKTTAPKKNGLIVVE